MNNDTLKTFLEARIAEVKKESNFHLRAMEGCAARIEELKTILVAIDDISKEEKYKNVQENIRKTPLKACFLESDDVKRVNVFLEFMDKCGDERVYSKCRVKMPKLEAYLYRKKSRLWPTWPAFLDDYDMWVHRVGPWSNILIKGKTD